MIDPISAVAIATSAFKTVTAMVNAGREVEDTLGQIGKWYGAVSDFNEAKKQAENPPLFRKLFAGKSVEQEAMELYMHQKKINKQEAELRTLLQYAFGPTGYQELVDMRRKIRDQRERTIYAQARRRKALIWNSISIVLIIGMSYGLYIMTVTILNHLPD